MGLQPEQRRDAHRRTPAQRQVRGTAQKGRRLFSFTRQKKGGENICGNCGAQSGVETLLAVGTYECCGVG